MKGISCPYCQEPLDDSETWVRVGDETPVDPDSSTVQLLLDDATGPESEQTREELEVMTTLHPCGHSFPRDDLKTVEEQFQILEELLEEHAESTNAFEIQLLRGEIHSVRENIDVATERCKEQMDATRPR